MKTTLKNNSRASDERGIALLFTLGILSLLLILAVAFATSSITQRKIASNNSDATYAKMLAESVLHKVVGVLQNYDEGAQYSHCDNSTHAGSPNHANVDWLYKLGTTDIFYWYDSYGSPENINWEFLTQYDSKDNTNKIKGRYAYIVIPGGGIDPVKLVSTFYDEGDNYPESDLSAAPKRSRFGESMEEINIKSIDKDDLFSSNLAVQKFNYELPLPGQPNGTYDAGKPWPDFETMFYDMGITDASAKESYRDWFILNTANDPEAFWLDMDGDNKVDFNINYPGTISITEDELYHRFNLMRTDWDSLVLDNTNGIIVPNSCGRVWPSDVTSDNSADIYSPGATSKDGRSIPWLDNLKDAGTFSSTAIRAKQIAANLIDYCDTNSNPKTDNENNPTYTGNELSPYINELGIYLQASAQVQSIWAGWGRTFTYSLNYSFSAELINMYGTAVENNKLATLEIEGTINYTYSRPKSDTVTVANSPITATINFNPDLSSGYSTSVWGSGAGTTAIAIPVLTDWAISSLAKITNVSVNISKVKLSYNGVFVDFSRPGVSKTISTLVEQNGVGGPTTGEGYFSYEANDPRQNLNTGDWSDTGKAKAEGGAAYCGTTGAINSNITCTGAGDAEAGSTPTTISTAYIRNSPMRSIWELGAIHRASQWETINLKQFNVAEGVKHNGGLGAYSSGDANILDQVKMTLSNSSPKKLNLKLQKDGLLFALFHKVRLGQDYATFGVDGSFAGTVLTEDKIWNFASASPDPTTLVYELKEKNINFYSRAGLAQVTKLFNGTCGTQTTDRQKEEIIGKVANITTVSSAEYFTIIVLAQAIKDIGGGVNITRDLDLNGTIGTANENTCRFDINGDNDSSDGSISETIAATTFGTYNQYADEILAEKKVMAHIHRDPTTKKIRILRYEFIND